MKLSIADTADTGATIRVSLAHSVATGTSLGLDMSSGALSLWRRLDWRFLLPDPNLQRVGYFGPPCDLLTALQTYSKSVLVFSNGELHPAYPRFDVAVLRHPSWSAVKQAARMVKPGGSLYMELSGSLRGIGKGSILSRENTGVVGYVRALWRAGYAGIQAYWHRPSFEDCREIIPLFDRVAMRYVLSRRGPAHLTREAMLLASRCLLEAGLLTHIVPCYSILAQKKD